MKCPKCGSKHTVPILYGKPLIDEEINQKLQRKELFLGGSEYSPRYHCFECGSNIASKPVFSTKHGKDDFRDMVTSVRFYVGGYFGGCEEILFYKIENKVFCAVNKNYRAMLEEMRANLSDKEFNSFLAKRKQKPFGFSEQEITKDEWKKLLSRLFCRLYIHEWNQYFYVDACDGTQWALEIKLTNGRVLNYHGSNDFPPYWKELKQTFEPYFKAARNNLL